MAHQFKTFDSFEEAKAFAKRWRGSTLKTNPTGNGWIVFLGTPTSAPPLPDTQKKSLTKKTPPPQKPQKTSNNYTFAKAKLIASKMRGAIVVKDTDGSGYVIKKRGIILRPNRKRKSWAQRKWENGELSAPKGIPIWRCG